MQVAYAAVAKFARFWCRESVMAEDRRVEEKRRNELTLPARLGGQDKASCLDSGTSFLSFCLHIVLGRSPTFRRDERAALFPIIILFQCSERRRPRHAENRKLPYLLWRRHFYAASRGLHFWSCAITFGFQSSSHGAQRRRLLCPSRQGP